MMREVLTRRFARLVKEERTAMRRKAKWPDLVLIDGGPGQLAVACQVFADLGVEDVMLVGISKGPDRDAGREHFYLPGREPFRLDPKSPVLYLPATVAGRGASLRHRQPSQEALEGASAPIRWTKSAAWARPANVLFCSISARPRRFRRRALSISKR